MWYKMPHLMTLWCFALKAGLIPPGNDRVEPEPFLEEKLLRLSLDDPSTRPFSSDQK
jgi:hypothetical protein